MYSDEVLCDIIDMTIFPRILGKPLQPNHGTYSSRKNNIYTFFKNHSKFIVKLLIDDALLREEKKEVTILNEKEFFQV